MFRSTLFSLLALLGLAHGLSAAWYGEADFSTCPRQYIPQTHGESEAFATQSECQADIAKIMAETTMACAQYHCEEKGSDGAASGGDSSLQDATSKALAEGLVHGDSQTFGMGLMGLGVMALTSGSSGPSPEEIASQQRMARQRAEMQRRADEAEALRKQRFEEDKEESMKEMKGGAPMMDDDDGGLKDDLNDTPAPARKKKKVPIIHLKPVEDILHKEPLEGDFQAPLAQFDSWDEAKACGGTTGKVSGAGKIVCCPPGFRYYCNGRCYREAALDDHRIPCSSTLMTYEQDKDLK